MKEIENLYKFQIAQDLILFLLNVQLDGLSPELKCERTDQLLQAWEKRINTYIKEQNTLTVKELCELNKIDLDVATILSSVHQIEPSIIREEFARDIGQIAIQNFKV